MTTKKTTPKTEKAEVKKAESPIDKKATSAFQGQESDRAVRALDNALSDLRIAEDAAKGTPRAEAIKAVVQQGAELAVLARARIRPASAGLFIGTGEYRINKGLIDALRDVERGLLAIQDLQRVQEVDHEAGSAYIGFKNKLSGLFQGSLQPEA